MIFRGHQSLCLCYKRKSSLSVRMRPIYEMIHREKRWSKNKSAEPVHEIKGPPIAALGWIPYFSPVAYWRSVRCEVYRRHPSWRLSLLGFPMLFTSGNKPEPSSNWTRTEDFLTFLAKKEFRAAVALSDVRLYTDRLGSPARIVYGELVESGFTPIRPLGLYSDSEFDDARVRWWRFRILPSGAGVTGDCELRVRLGQPWRNLAEYTASYPVPFITFRISYTLRKDGSGEAGCSSSDIPSQRWYCDWQRAGDHDMMSITASEIDSFFGSGLEAPQSKKWSEPF